MWTRFEVLLDYGADVNAQEELRGQTALMWAAAERHAAVAQMLLDHGADLHARSKVVGLTPLMFAVRAGDVGTTRAFLEAGADLEESAADGTSVLVLSIINAHYELAAWLLDLGADPRVADPRGSALHAVTFMRRANNHSLSTVLPGFQRHAGHPRPSQDPPGPRSRSQRPDRVAG